MNYNNLDSLHSELFSGLTSLTLLFFFYPLLLSGFLLFIDNNRLSSLPPHVFDHLTQLESFHVPLLFSLMRFSLHNSFHIIPLLIFLKTYSTIWKISIHFNSFCSFHKSLLFFLQWLWAITIIQSLNLAFLINSQVSNHSLLFTLLFSLFYLFLEISLGIAWQTFLLICFPLSQISNIFFISISHLNLFTFLDWVFIRTASHLFQMYFFLSRNWEFFPFLFIVFSISIPFIFRKTVFLLFHLMFSTISTVFLYCSISWLHKSFYLKRGIWILTVFPLFHLVCLMTSYHWINSFAFLFVFHFPLSISVFKLTYLSPSRYLL